MVNKNHLDDKSSECHLILEQPGDMPGGSVVKSVRTECYSLNTASSAWATSLNAIAMRFTDFRELWPTV